MVLAGKDSMTTKESALKTYAPAKNGSRSDVVAYDDYDASTRSFVVGGLSKAAADDVARALANAFVQGARWRANQQGGTQREGNGLMTCNARFVGAQPVCGGTVFVEYPRSLDYYNYQCVTCGAMTLRLTETGMSA